MNEAYVVVVCMDQEDPSNVGDILGLYEDESDALAFAVCHLEEIVDVDDSYWSEPKVESGKTGSGHGWVTVLLENTYWEEALGLLIEKYNIKEKS